MTPRKHWGAWAALCSSWRRPLGAVRPRPNRPAGRGGLRRHPRRRSQDVAHAGHRRRDRPGRRGDLPQGGRRPRAGQGRPGDAGHRFRRRLAHQGVHRDGDRPAHRRRQDGLGRPGAWAPAHVPPGRPAGRPRRDAARPALSSHRPCANDLLWRYAPWGLEESVRRMGYLEPSHSFRSAYEYNNLGYIAAGLAVGSASKSTWREEVQKRLLDPLGMTGAVFTRRRPSRRPTTPARTAATPTAKSRSFRGTTTTTRCGLPARSRPACATWAGGCVPAGRRRPRRQTGRLRVGPGRDARAADRDAARP